MPKEFLRITPVGDIDVGKTSIIRQYIHKRFNENKIEESVDDDISYRKLLTINNVEYLLDFINFEDLGIDRIYTTPMLCNSTGYLLIYSITSKESFNNLKKRRDAILFANDKNNNIPILLIGNKCDLEHQRQVSINDGKNLAKSFNNCLFFETSSKTGENIDIAFDSFFNQIEPIIFKKSNNSGKKKNNSCNIL